MERLGIPTAVAGGLAMAAWKHPRATRDIDLLFSVEPDAQRDLLESLRHAGLRPKRDPPVVALGQLDVIQLLYEPAEAYLDIHVDLLLAKSEYQRLALSRRVPTQLPDLDVPVAVLACEDLILGKLAAGRMIDFADASALLRLNRENLDGGYLLHWAGRIKALGDLNGAWNEAFPGVPLPQIEFPGKG
jgi:hypothetical protein